MSRTTETLVFNAVGFKFSVTTIVAGCRISLMKNRGRDSIDVKSFTDTEELERIFRFFSEKTGLQWTVDNREKLTELFHRLADQIRFPDYPHQASQPLAGY